MDCIVIIGSGPSALFAAKTILELNKTVMVNVLEKGKQIRERVCPAKGGKCMNCKTCAVLEGGGGAGLFSDGKLVLDLSSGGIAQGVRDLSYDEKKEIENEILQTFSKFDGVSKYKEMPSDETIQKTSEIFASEDLNIKFYNVLHMGSHNLPNITSNFIDYLTKNFSDRFCIVYDTAAIDIKKTETGYAVLTEKEEYYADCIIVAVGKSGAEWFKSVADKLGISYTIHPFFFGVRMETGYENIKDLENLSFDPKIYRIKNNRRMKIHCFCRKGQVLFYKYKETMNVGGHSPYNENDSDAIENVHNANFNVLLSYDKTQIHPNTILSLFREKCHGATAVQKLDDFIANRLTTSWGKYFPSGRQKVSKQNIREILDTIDPTYSQMFIEFLGSLSKLYPGIMDMDNILYAPTIEWDMDSVVVDSNMETNSNNLFAVGDGAGLSQGIVFSAATGILAAKEIAKRFS